MVMKNYKTFFKITPVNVLTLLMSAQLSYAQELNAKKDILLNGHQPPQHSKEEKIEPHIVQRQNTERLSLHKLRFTILASYDTVDGEQISNGSRGTMNSAMYPALKLDYAYSLPKWVLVR